MLVFHPDQAAAQILNEQSRNKYFSVIKHLKIELLKDNVSAVFEVNYSAGDLLQNWSRWAIFSAD